MICDVCGRDNADKLTFCQDCGRRLQAAPSRGVEPTPPTGVPKFELPVAAPQDAAEPPPGSQAQGRATQRSRPEAPAFAFGPPVVDTSEDGDAPIRTPALSSPAPRLASPNAKPMPAPVPIATAPRPVPAPVQSAAIEAAPAAASPAARCTSCETENPPNYRFCVSCGAALGGALASKAPSDLRPVPAPPLPPPSPPAAAAGEEKIVPTPVVDIASTRAPEQRLVACSRCHGQCAPGTRFCKFCGAPLEEGAPAAPVLAVAQFSNAAARELPPPPLRSAARDSAPGPAPATVPPAEAPPPPRPGATEPGRSDPARAAGARELGRLVIISEDGSEGRSYPLTAPQVDIGRTEGDVILRDDPYVSPRHARFVETKEGLLLRDLGSTNGVFVRIRRREPLRDGDLLLLGLEVLQFQTVSNAERGLGHASQHGTLLFGSPAVPRHARLCQRTIEGVTRDVHHLFRDETVIGREQGDVVFSSDPFMSRRHAAVSRDATTGEFSIRDLESSNGSYLALRGDVRISSGDFVRVGQHLFRVDLR